MGFFYQQLFATPGGPILGGNCSTLADTVFIYANNAAESTTTASAFLSGMCTVVCVLVLFRPWSQCSERCCVVHFSPFQTN